MKLEDCRRFRFADCTSEPFIDCTNIASIVPDPDLSSPHVQSEISLLESRRNSERPENATHLVLVGVVAAE
jgi:hypothetical protein